MSTAALLAQVRARRQALDQAQQIYGERLAPDFGVFQFIDTSEEGISQVLAWLLDPRSDHAQGDRFLRAFLAWLDLDWSEQAIRKARVQTEAPVASATSTRFIDVLLSGQGYALAVENKLGAPDQPRQVSDYLKFLQKGYGTRSCLLYLTPDGRSPSEKSISAPDASAARSARHLIERSYQSLIDFLKHCLPMARAQKVSFFIDDLIRHITQSVLGVENMEETAKLAAEITADPRDLSAALEIFETEREVKKILIMRCQSEIKERFQALGWTILGDVDAGDGGDYLMALFDAENTWGFGFSFYQSNYRTMFYGLARKDDADARRRPKAELIAFLNGVQQGRGDAEWPWWVKPHPHNHFFPYPAGWAGTKDFWIAANNGEFAERVVSFASAMQMHLKKAKMLTHLQ